MSVLRDVGRHGGTSGARRWEQLWIQESSPSDAEREKVRERVQKIVAVMQRRPGCLGV